MPKKHIFGVRPEFRATIPTAQKGAGIVPLGVTPPEGTTQGSGMICSQFFNEAFYKNACDWVVGKKNSDVIVNNANCYYDSDSQTFKDKEHNTITFLTGDRIHFYGLDPLTADMVFNTDELEITSKEGVQLDLGDNGGTPYKIQVNGNHCRFDIKTTSNSQVLDLQGNFNCGSVNGEYIDQKRVLFSSDGVNGTYFESDGGPSHYNWLISQQKFTDGSLEFTPSNTQGAADFTSPVLKIKRDGSIEASGTAVGVPIGSTVLWWGTAAPSKWLACDGSEISEVAYPELYAELTANLNFPIIPSPNRVALPDTRDMFIRGWHSSVGRNDDWEAPNTSSRTDIGGTNNAPVQNQAGSYEMDEFESHSHRIEAGADDTYNGVYTGRDDTGAYPAKNTELAGGSETRPKNISAMYIIRAEY